MKFKPKFKVGDVVFVDEVNQAVILKSRAGLEYFIEYDLKVSKKKTAKMNYWIGHDILDIYNADKIRNQKIENILL